MVKNPPANAGDTGAASSTPGSGRSPGVRNGHALQYSCLENPIYRGAWQATICRVKKNWTRLKQLNMQAAMCKSYGRVASIFTNVFAIIFILAILVGMQWRCIVILVCISLVTSEAEHHFVYCWSFEYFLFVKWLFQAFSLPPPF